MRVIGVPYCGYDDEAAGGADVIIAGFAKCAMALQLRWSATAVSPVASPGSH